MNTRFLRFTGLAALAFGFAFSPASRADEAAQKMAAQHLEAGTLAEGDAALSAVLDKDPENHDARFGLGVVRFVRALEHLSQGLYRYGLRPPQNFYLVPVVRLPVPVNPEPESITYQDFHDLVAGFVGDLARAEATLAGIGPGDAHLPLDLRLIRYDVVGDGKSREPMLAVIQRISGMREEDLAGSLAFNFDRADAIWLRGYSHFLMALGEFFAAHDWHESFDYTFHLFFPKAGLPFTNELFNPRGDDFNNIADLISFFHIRWEVAEPARLLAVHNHLKAMVALSRENWDAILAETDDDREWLPSPKQTSRFAAMTVREDHVAAWRAMLDEAEAILDGRKLVPHWRFNQGINFKRIFTEPRPFDFVLWITGPGALPYLETGTLATSEEWSRIMRAFDVNFGAYAAWFN